MDSSFYFSNQQSCLKNYHSEWHKKRQMDIQLNNKSIQIDEAISVQQLIDEQNISSKGIAVAINNDVVAKSNWSETKIKEHDNIIIITATQGG